VRKTCISRWSTNNHATLLQRLKTSYGISGTVLNWLSSYLCNHSQFVRCSASKSTRRFVTCGVPQGSVLGPILFLLYTADLQRLVETHRLLPHLYADDTQICGSCRPTETLQLRNRLSECVDDVASWMRSNRLQLNSAKTEVLWCSSSRPQHQIPQSEIRIGTDVVMPSLFVHDLGIYIDADVSMRTHVA
jgi:Reverse transcriptase (RNA-dependent DNA polymerase)